MADNKFRVSGIYIAPEMEGYLEKKKQGMIVRKTKTWCSIQGSCMYLKKNQGVMDTLDLCEAHQVKKVSSDSSGTSFEIAIKKKSYTFICPTREECSQWVKALHNAMAQKDSGLRGSTFFVDEPVENQTDGTKYESIYTTITGDEAEQTNKNKTDSICKVSDYSAPYDAQTKCNGGVEPVYYEVNSGAPLPQTTLSKNSIYEDVSSIPTVNSEHETQLYQDGYSQINKCKPSQNDDITVMRASKNMPISCTNKTNADQASTDNNINVFVDAKLENTSDACLRTSVNTAFKSESASTSLGQQNTLETVKDDPFSMLVAALAIDESPIPEFNHPLTDEDSLPVKELSEFLAKNHTLCYVRYSQVTISEDPVASLKSFLKDLNLPS